MRIVVAMSGGVDSSVAAALLAEAGHEVVGISMRLYPHGAEGPDGSSVAAAAGDAAQAHETRFGTCCTLDDLHDARRVAATLGFPHYMLDFQNSFEQAVMQNFVDEYAAGRTPIPCAHCNSDVKFSALLERACGFGADALATGHYARVARANTGRMVLRRGADPRKDQSYFLFSLTQAQLERACFPVGELEKDVVREIARRLGLAVADKPESQEICFVPDGNYAAFVERRAPALATAGPIVDERGQQLGTHAGVHRFTVGQRKGLGLSSREPLYVQAVDAGTGTVRVGPRAGLEQTRLTASGVNWISGVAPSGWQPVAGQIRHRHLAAPGRVRALSEGRAELVFDTPQTAITPGQAAVFYDGDEVVGGGWIE